MRWVLLLLAILLFPLCLFADTPDKEEVLETYPAVQFKVNLTGSGEQDTITLSCKKVKDSSTNPYTNVASKEKFTWYHFHLTIDSPSKENLWDDEFSSQEGDYQGLFEHFGLTFRKPRDYMNQFFSKGLSNLNGIEKRKIDKDEIDDDLIRKIIKDMKSKSTVQEVEKEMLAGKHTVVYYRGDWAEDLRQATYSQKLHSAFGLTSPY